MKEFYVLQVLHVLYSRQTSIQHDSDAADAHKNGAGQKRYHGDGQGVFANWLDIQEI